MDFLAYFLDEHVGWTIVLELLVLQLFVPPIEQWACREIERRRKRDLPAQLVTQDVQHGRGGR